MRLSLTCQHMVVLVFALTEISDSAKILAYFPLPANSHHKVFQPVLRELAVRGHKIDYLSPFGMENPHENVRHISVNITMKCIFEGAKISLIEQLRMPIHSVLLQMKRFTISSTTRICNLKPVQRLSKSNAKYDMVIHEGPFLQEHAGLFVHKFNALGVAFMPSATISMGEECGLPDNPAFMVDPKLSYSDTMSFFQRLHNAYSTWLTVLTHYWILYQTEAVIDECFKYPEMDSRPSLYDLASDNALILVNSHHSLGFSYPAAPHVKEIGGVNILPNNPLPKELNDFISQAEHGVIYFSLGTLFDMSSSMETVSHDIYARAFSRMKERVLWKWNSEPWANVPQNVMLAKWFPQQDLLAHKNVKLFLTHGGLLSSFEAIHHAVPLLVTPIFADQAINAQRIADAGIGEQIALWNVTEELLFGRMRQMIDDPKYKREVERRSAMLKDRPMKPVEEGAFWIEYVLKHGRVLQPVSSKLLFIQLHQLDVLVFILFSLGFLIYIVTRLLEVFMIRSLPRVIVLNV